MKQTSKDNTLVTNIDVTPNQPIGLIPQALKAFTAYTAYTQQTFTKHVMAIIIARQPFEESLLKACGI